MPYDMGRVIGDTTRTLETMAIAEPAAAGYQLPWAERNREALLLLPVAAAVTALPRCRHEASIRLM